VNNETKKLKDYVKRNEAYIESAEWVTEEINNVIDQFEIYQQSGMLPREYKTEEALYSRMLELDKRAAIEERIYKKLRDEQRDLLDEM